ncbi:MAG: hypothetical protein A2784_02395 [Candidatus Chisholmbacteria bacterium RIFCSPHIGHO2_01_FULL_48_12]|uniref:DUF1648 domain-containing protein n=1 Tax=Candidatus Chisholmbacteria bacterium RIFCSPHIGHO2_01_FULL_48_12 TaxID=1797589 RepID=A0A1G1VUS3_9BACT|nr:MAG: hypothetical protein A2784_02395 [Candidatus Chisholmbacteria bacterium RIFCSPHIGHO2_01_FULL_48_12]
MKWLVALAIGSGMMVAVTYRRLPPEIPLWFSRPWGAAQLAPKLWVVILPGSMLLISIGAIVAARMVDQKERLLAQMIMGGSIVIDFLLAYALLRIINLSL